MNSYKNRLEELNIKLNTCFDHHKQLEKEIFSIKFEISNLKSTLESEIETSKNISTDTIPKKEPHKETISTTIKKNETNYISNIITKQETKQESFQTKLFDIEKFIGENLISKIGIIITIIGVIIGAKYSIEHNLITPTARISLGYILGGVLLFTAYKLKQKYNNYSAVLASGSMAILYFISYSAYSIYNLFPNLLSFTLMIGITFYTVFIALKYNKSVIAHIGLVGAYAIPFLLSSQSENVVLLLTYVSIINFGIIAISIKRSWKSLYFSAFGFSWLIFISCLIKIVIADSISIFLPFLLVFYLSFYSTFIFYKIINKENFNKIDLFPIFFNTGIFYVLGCFILLDKNYIGLFTLGNSIFNFGVYYYLKTKKILHSNLFNSTLAFSIIFLTLSIPIQFMGSTIYLLWLIEAIVLLYISLKNYNKICLISSYCLGLLSFILYLNIIIINQTYGFTSNITIINIIDVVGFAFFYWSHKKIINSNQNFIFFKDFINNIIPSILIVSIYYLLFNIISKVIDCYFSSVHYSNLKTIWLINYTLFFISVLAYLNLKKIKSFVLRESILVISLAMLLIYITINLSFIGQNTLILNNNTVDLFNRYSSYFFLIALFVNVKSIFNYKIRIVELKILFDSIIHFTLLYLISFELICWTESYKLALSILWGIYALGLIIWGISKQIKHIRIAAFILIGCTLIKLFLYDITHLSTISKTIIFISLGIVLLTISYLYNKFKNKINSN